MKTSKNRPITSGIIPGKVNPGIADDVMINAKKGEYILTPEDVTLLGGPQAIAALVKNLRQKAGLPTATGPKRHDQPDNLGRMDKKGLKGVAGLASGGNVDWHPPYETDLGALAKAHPIANVIGLGIPAITQKIAGTVGNIGSAMFAPTDDPWALMKGRTQDVADQLGSAAKNISLPAAVATQVITGQPITGNTPIKPVAATPAKTITDAPLRVGNLGMPRMGPQDLSVLSTTGKPPAPINPNATAPTAPLTADPNGFAIVGGKRIDYSKIGIAGDPQKNKGGVITAPGADPSGRDVNWSPGSANYTNAVADAAMRKGIALDSSAPGGMRLMNMGEMDAAGVLTPQQRIARNDQDINTQMQVIAGNMGNDYNGAQNIAAAKMRIAGLQGMNTQLQQGIAGDQALAGQKYNADAGIAGHRITADAGIEQQKLSSDAHVKAAQLTSEGHLLAAQAKAQQDATKQAQTDYKDRVSGLVKDWSKLNLPPELIPNLHRYAALTTEAEDPKGSVFMLAANGPNRANLALPKSYEKLYQMWRSKGYNHNDAAAAVAAEAKKAGHGEYVPNLNNFATLQSARNNAMINMEQ